MKRLLVKTLLSAILLSGFAGVGMFAAPKHAQAACSGVEINELLVQDLCDTTFPFHTTDSAPDTVVTNHEAQTSVEVKVNGVHTCTLKPGVLCNIYGGQTFDIEVDISHSTSSRW